MKMTKVFRKNIVFTVRNRWVYLYVVSFFFSSFFFLSIIWVQGVCNVIERRSPEAGVSGNETLVDGGSAPS